MDDIKLRPCPFCGSEAYLIINDGARVLCPKCGATSKILVDNIVGYNSSKNAVKSVIEAWNKRVPDKMQQPISAEWTVPQYDAPKYDIFYCSNCHGTPLLNDEGGYDFSAFCPHCGAEMEMDREMFLFQRFKNMSNSIIHKNMSNSCV